MGNVIMKAQQIVYGASNVEKALDDLKAPELIELNKRMAAIDEWKANVHEVTYTGSKLTINNALKIPARSLITSINAIQDLHGYDKPWAGGAGDNKFGGKHFADVVKEQFSDAIIDTTAQTVSYIASGISDKILYSNFDANTRYTFMYEMASGSFTNLGVEYTDGTTVELSASPFVTDSSKSVRYLKGVWHSGETVMKYNKFGVFKGVLTAGDYSPYENICPISGRTAATLTRSDGDEISEDFTIQLGTTVYGADINWDTGVATVLWASKAFSDIDDWNFNASYHIAYCYVTGKANGYDTIMSDSYKVVNKPYTEMVDGEIAAVQGQDGMNVKDDRFDNLSDFMTAMGSSQLVYKLATPTTIQLTPTQLQMLKGYNRVSIEDGSIELKALVLGGDN